MEPRYATPQALRQAVTARLRTLAAQRPGTTPGDLQRRFAYDRLLARVFTADADIWVLKGAAAMLARLPTAARHSKDIDLYRRHGDLSEAHEALAAAAALDLADHFRFNLGTVQPLTQGARALRVPITAYLGVTEFARFHADLVANLVMTGAPDEVPALIHIDLGLVKPKYRAYPVVDHIADKVCAMLETHPRIGGDPIPSTRYRDLVDLATFARTTEIDGPALATALRSESDRRGVELPNHLPDPLGADWRAGYARTVQDAPNLADRDLASALQTVRAMLDPVLAARHAGVWDPATLAWRCRCR
jgi:hypothetical protein